MLESNSDLNIDETILIGTAIDVMDEQVNLLKDQPGRSPEALTALRELLSKVIDLLRERREAQDQAEPSSKSPEWIEAVWVNFNEAVDEHASESEDPDGVRDIYNGSIAQFVLEGQERCMISKRSDPRRSLKVLVVVEDLTRGLIKLRNTPP
jgi:flagellar biosynthesis regulator FlaF